MLRLALVGGADVGTRYARIAARVPGARITAVADPDPRSAGETCRALGIDDWAEGLDRLLTGPAVFDAVLIHSPEESRERDCRLATEAGKHVLVESPPARSAAAAELLVALCRDCGVSLMVAQSQRFRPGVRTVKSGFDDGKLGEPGLVRIHRWVPRPGGARADEDPGLAFLPMVDDIDLACWLFGHGPATLLATGNRGAAPAGGCDCLQLHLGFPGDGMALIESGALPRGDGYFSLTAIGSKGAAYADDHENMQLLYRGGHPTALRTGEGDHPLLLQLEAFVTAVDKGREPPVRGEDAAQVLRVAEAAAASLARGVAMRLDNGRWRPEGEGT